MVEEVGSVQGNVRISGQFTNVVEVAVGAEARAPQQMNTELLKVIWD